MATRAEGGRGIDRGSFSGAVYTMSNAAGGNSVLVFDSLADGRLVIDRDGLPTETRVQTASGVTPFGFAFGRRDQVFVTEAFGGALDSCQRPRVPVMQEQELLTRGMPMALSGSSIEIREVSGR